MLIVRDADGSGVIARVSPGVLARELRRGHVVATGNPAVFRMTARAAAITSRPLTPAQRRRRFLARAS